MIAMLVKEITIEPVKKKAKNHAKIVISFHHYVYEITLDTRNDIDDHQLYAANLLYFNEAGKIEKRESKKDHSAKKSSNYEEIRQSA